MDKLGIVISLLSVLLPLAMANPQELQAVVKGNGQFTKDLYGILAKQPGNVFFSPISAHAVLAMAYQGAVGSTQEAFQKTLHLPDSQTAANGYQDVMSHLNNVDGVALLMANKVYVMEGRTLKQSFKDVVTKQFLSEVENVNFADSENTAEKINTWVEEKTQEKIKNLISADSLTSDSRLVLVNAIYFKGNWASKFNPALTKPEPFYLNDVDSVEVEMMNQKSKYLYKDDEALDAKVLEMPYANPDVSLVVVLPNKKDGIADLEKKLATADLTRITEGMFKTDVNVKLPKFKIETTVKLNDALEKVGLGVIFSSQANFSNMLESPEPLAVSEVIQKAFIEVNEEGTEAAAATGKVLMKRSLEFPEEFSADHTFLIMLRYGAENHRKILFFGKILEPRHHDSIPTKKDEL